MEGGGRGRVGDIDDDECVTLAAAGDDSDDRRRARACCSCARNLSQQRRKITKSRANALGNRCQSVRPMSSTASIAKRGLRAGEARKQLASSRSVSTTRQREGGTSLRWPPGTDTYRLRIGRGEELSRENTRSCEESAGIQVEVPKM